MLAIIFEQYASTDLLRSLHDQLDVISANGLVQGAGSGDVRVAGSRSSIGSI